MKKILLSLAILLFFTTQSFAHALWVNVHESFAHPPGHMLTSLGWGHVVPMDDFLMSKDGAMSIEKYQLTAPNGNITPIPLPVIKKEKSISSATGMTITPGDLGLQKIALTSKTKPGTYMISVESPATYFTGYVDKKGKSKMTLKPMDKVKGATSFNFSTRYKATAKSYVGIKEWTDPQPAGFDLELMPQNDLSQVKAGDMISFDIKLLGVPVNSDVQTGIKYLTMTSNTFGGPDNYVLAAYILNGKAQVRVPTAGEWVANVTIKRDVKENNELAKLKGKCMNVYYGTTLSFNAKP